MISVQHVTTSYGRTVVVDDVSLTIADGGVTALVGPNGAGKSTLLKVIARLLQADAGVVTVADLDVARTAPEVLARRLAVLAQDTQVPVRLTVRDLVTFGRFPHTRGRPTAEDHALVEEAMAHLDITDLADRYLDEISGGQRQRAFIAMVFAQDTDHLLLDEPLNNLDMRHGAQLMQIVRDAADRRGTSIVLVVHDINAASVFADHIIALKDGRVVTQGPPQEVMVEDVLESVFDVPVRVVEVDGHRQAIHLSGRLARPRTG